MNHDSTIEVPFLNLARVTADIAAEGGHVASMRVETNCYILSVKWPENVAGGTTERESAAPPVQHESNDLNNDSQQMP